MENTNPTVQSYTINLTEFANAFAQKFQTAKSQLIRTMLTQIGAPIVLAISGGRWIEVDEGTVHLPIDKRWKVEVKYDYGRDTYIVSRLRRYKNTDQWRVAGRLTDVYCDQVGEVADEASLYLSVPDFGK